MIMTTSALFEPYKLGDITLSNRVVMGPLTRNRAGESLAPSPFAAEYYAEPLSRPDYRRPGSTTLSAG